MRAVTPRDPERDMTDPSRTLTEPLNHASRTPSRRVTDEGVTLPLIEKGSRDRDRLHAETPRGEEGRVGGRLDHPLPSFDFSPRCELT